MKPVYNLVNTESSTGDGKSVNASPQPVKSDCPTFPHTHEVDCWPGRPVKAAEGKPGIFGLCGCETFEEHKASCRECDTVKVAEPLGAHESGEHENCGIDFYGIKKLAEEMVRAIGACDGDGGCRAKEAADDYSKFVLPNPP